MPPGVEGSERLAARWDDRTDAHTLDFGWIGEDKDGVWTTVHPVAALAKETTLHGVWFDHIAGIKPTSDDLRCMTLYEQDAWQVIASALVRESSR